MSEAQSSKAASDWSTVLSDRLKEEAVGLVGALSERAVKSLTSAAGRLTEYAENGGGPGLAAAVTGARQIAEGKSPLRAAAEGGSTAVKNRLFGGSSRSGKSSGKKGGSLKVTNIVESIDVGVPVRLAYDQWTQFRDFPTFMKKVESVDQEADEKLNFRAQIFLSHRSWESTILQQIPDERIIWNAKGSKGHVDGTVTFHELAPNLTRILVVLEYHPQGFFEQTGNMWRAQGRRVRLELKHFRRHVMRNVLPAPDEIEGWRGVIEDGEVVKDHETAVREEERAAAGDEDRGGRGRRSVRGRGPSRPSRRRGRRGAVRRRGRVRQRCGRQ